MWGAVVTGPEWISMDDNWKRRAKRAEATLAAIRAYCERLTSNRAYHMATRETADGVLALLDAPPAAE